MPALSIVMIVKNEAGRLGECLASVRGIADEIVVGDTGSTDSTVAVAEGFGARVLTIPWRDDFAWARNRVLEAATGDWLLHVDADEAVDSEGAGRIRALVDTDGAGADAIEVTLANYCDEPRAWRWVAAAPDAPMARGRAGYIAAPLLRLFRNGRGFEYR
ncbi:MAG TPA: glycosyltransferase family 2 protein, partial [Candidatus Hydrogenedentes bacterium]|nr:glycosyltransferase family 2 protein [Candidatus Hydrogenedentota bacterium]